MRKLSIIIFLVILNIEFVTGQTNCGCDSIPLYNSIVSCDTIKFDNGAKLYRQFNCDSMWLTIENADRNKRILYSLKGEMIELTPRLGYQFIKEYSNTILFMNRQSSGGGVPMNYELINKENGEIFKKIGSLLYYTKDNSHETVVTLKNDSIPLLVFFNIKTGITKEFPINNEVNGMTKFISNEMFPENRFRNARLESNLFKIECRYKNTNNEKSWHKKEITVQLTDE